MTAHQEIIPGAPVLPLVPRSIEETWRIAVAVMKAGIAPDGVDTPEKALIILMHGLEVGFTPMAALQSIALIKKRPVIWGDGALALVRRHPDFEWIRESMHGEGAERIATCNIKRRGEEYIARDFSWQDAITAELVNKDIWKKYPDRMLQMRARAFALRDAFADAFKGLGIREEVMDYDMPRNAPKPPMGASKGHTATPGHPEVTTLPGAIPVAGEGEMVERGGAGFETIDPKTGEVTEEPLYPVKVPPRPPQPPRPSARTAVVEQDTFPPDRLRVASVETGTNGKPSHPMGPLSAGLPTHPTQGQPVKSSAPSAAILPSSSTEHGIATHVMSAGVLGTSDPGPIPPNLVRRGTVEALVKHRPDFSRDPIVRIYEYIEGLFKLVQTFDEFEKVCERYIDPFVADIPQGIDQDGIRGFIMEYEQRFAP